MNAVKGNTEKTLKVCIKYLKGIGEVRSRWFANLGVQTLRDLLEFFPRAYIQRSANKKISEMSPGDNIAIVAIICWIDKHLTSRNQSVLTIGVSDGEAPLLCTWFRFTDRMIEELQPGKNIWIAGVLSEYNGNLQLTHPDYEVLDGDDELDFWKTRKVLPIYSLSGKLTQSFMRKIIYNSFQEYSDLIEDNLPDIILTKYNFENRKTSLQLMHFSQHIDLIEKTKNRFIYEEFFYTQILWGRHRYFHQKSVCGITFENKRQLTTRLYKRLPFSLTNAQKSALNDIFADMTSNKQMSRLLQGDVGSGKTIVTLFAMLLAVENGYQAALMAPTEILAEQHFQNISRFLELESNIKVGLIKGGNYKGKQLDKEAISSGSFHIIIGTHALIQADITFCNLGFIAIDEQQRFGVEQRAILARHHNHPDTLYLSATPIPRSLAMTVYGDLEISIINELPPNRKPVETVIRPASKIDIVFSEIRKFLIEGRQVFFVCPLIEESEKIDLIDAERLYNHISIKIFPDLKCELLHGKMKATVKDDIMNRFKNNEIKVLVSTTVIEVGVDVPNASIMVIEHAERFGLAQLHQLRGRIGRGSNQSKCYLIEHQPVSSIGYERLNTIVHTNDGFVIAEKDLELRGPGELFGYEQSGLPKLKFANLIHDQHILSQAREDAFEIVQTDPHLEKPEHKLLKQYFTSYFAKKEELIKY